MKALLVWPHFSSFSFWNFEKVCELTGTKYMTPPLGLLTVAALLPKDWEIKVVDENVRPLVEADYTWSDIVLVSSKIVHRQRALDVIREAKRHGKPVVVGGPDHLEPRGVLTPRGRLCARRGRGRLADDAPTWPRVKGGCTGPRGRRPEQSPVRADLIDHRDYLYPGLQCSAAARTSEFCNVIDLFDPTAQVGTGARRVRMMYDLGSRGNSLLRRQPGGQRHPSPSWAGHLMSRCLHLSTGVHEHRQDELLGHSARRSSTSSWSASRPRREGAEDGAEAAERASQCPRRSTTSTGSQAARCARASSRGWTTGRRHRRQIIRS
jgi:hypothetical protein